jgi:hypothetical protein
MRLGEVDFWVRNRVELGKSLETFDKVGKITKIWAKLTKSGGVALAEVCEMCKKFEFFRRF